MTGHPDPKGPLDQADGAVLARIRQMFDAVDPVPVDLYMRVRFAIDLESADREFARLCEAMPLATRAAGDTEQPSTLMFECDSLTIGITISRPDGTAIRVDGWHAPVGSLRIELRTAELRMETMSDASGRFVIDGVPPGEMQLLAHPTPGSTVHLPRTVITPLIAL